MVNYLAEDVLHICNTNICNAVFQDKLPSNSTYGYDFRETSAASHAVVVEKVKKADFGEDHDYTGTLWLLGYTLSDIMLLSDLAHVRMALPACVWLY